MISNAKLKFPIGERGRGLSLSYLRSRNGDLGSHTDSVRAFCRPGSVHVGLEFRHRFRVLVTGNHLLASLLHIPLHFDTERCLQKERDKWTPDTRFILMGKSSGKSYWAKSIIELMTSDGIRIRQERTAPSFWIG
jgi:hypothetical protein